VVAFVDRGDTGERPAATAQTPGAPLAVAHLPEAKRGFVLLPRRYVVERTFAWLGRHRLVRKDDEAPPGPEAAWIELATIRLMAARLAT
jgi:transposase